MLHQVEAGVLSIGFEQYGSPEDPCVVLLHGFPYDIQAYAEVAPLLSAKHFRVIVPYLRGYGSTHFLSPATYRSGQQAALGYDLIALLDALTIETAILAGYDWGGRAACIVAALWPSRVAGLVTGGGYNIQQIDRARFPAEPEAEMRYWYQYYLHSERGRAGLAKYRYEFCRLLWQLWSPNWRFPEAVYRISARSFENIDFVDIVVHSYRHRFGLVSGDPALEDIEKRLASGPPIPVPSIALEGEADGVDPVGSFDSLDHLFRDKFERRLIPQAGHNLPQEAPAAFADAIFTIANITRNNP